MTEQKANTQDSFLNELRKSKQPVRVLLSNGKEILGIITGFDQFTFTLQLADTEVLIYKSAVAIISPEETQPASSKETGDNSA